MKLKVWLAAPKGHPDDQRHQPKSQAFSSWHLYRGQFCEVDVLNPIHPLEDNRAAI